jgi:membrane protease YdiL (CAAX protease family)
MEGFSKVKLFGVAFIINILFSAFFILLVEVLKSFGVPINDSSELAKMFIENPALVWVLAVIFMPILEELIFRSQLRFRSNILIKMLSPNNIRQDREIKIAKLRERWDRHYTTIFYSFSILFVLAHYSNFNTSQNPFLVLLVLLAPIFITGVFLGYVRVRINIWASILFHSLFNLLAITLAVAF